MKNVIIFAVDSQRYAVELRWVREVITLSHVTPIPGAPAHVAGAINMRGAITPVLDLGALANEDTPARPAGPDNHVVQGDGAVLIDVEGMAMALRMNKVEEVSTVSESPGTPAHEASGPLASAIVDSRGRRVALLDPPELVRLTLALAHAHRELPHLAQRLDAGPGERDI